MNRTYITANNMQLKTKNAKQSWVNGNAKLEILHVTRRDHFWIECLDAKGEAIAKDIDQVDAKIWLERLGFELPDVLK